MKNTFNLSKAAKLILCSGIVFASTQTFANNISIDQVTKDITYLASDDLKGRGNFSAEIDVAANYISDRFKALGLEPMQGEKSFKQTFHMYNVAPKAVEVTLNDKSIDAKNIAMASTMEKFHWNSTEKVQVSVIGKDDNMRAIIGGANAKGGQHLILLNTAHAGMFARYQAYFNRGLNKLSLDEKGAIVIVLTDDTKVDSLSAQGLTNISERKLSNVVGVLPGKSKSDEIVLYSAHYDHLGVGKDGDDVIYNGADDDASGTTAVLNLAEYFAKQKDRQRSIMFAAFTAEEIGGFGSQYFSKQLDPNDVVAMINIEMIGKPSKFGAGKVWMTGMDRSDLGEQLNANLAEGQGKIHPDPYPKQNLFYRSDNATLARLGVPAHSFSSTQLDKDQHYHKTSDDLASLDLNSMHQVIEMLSISTQGLVDGKITPSRIDANKVRGRGKIF